MKGNFLHYSFLRFVSEFVPFLGGVLPFWPLHADPGGIKDAHQSQHSLQDVSDHIRGHAKGADLRQSFRPDVPNSMFGFIHQRLHRRRIYHHLDQEQITDNSQPVLPYLHFFQLIINFSLSFFNLFHFLSHFPLYLFHFCLLVAGILNRRWSDSRSISSICSSQYITKFYLSIPSVTLIVTLTVKMKSPHYSSLI